MAYENLCMYCFEDMNGQTVCPHCGRDSRAAVPQIQMLPGSQIYHGRFLVGRALGQDATGIVYSAFDTKKENRLRIREYLPRDCAERLNDGAVVPVAGMEDQFEAGLKKLRASVENVEDPRKRHFFFEENGTGYIAQRKSASAAAEHDREPETEEDRGGKGRVLLFGGIAVAVLVVAAVLLITVFNGAMTTTRDITQSPTLDPSQIWIPETTPTATPYVAPTFAALVDPELSWMDYTYDGDVEQEYQQAQRAAATPVPTSAPTISSGDTQRYKLVNGDSSREEIRALQKRLYELGWLEKSQVTGKYDTATRQAVRDFQAHVNDHYKPRERLSVDGVAGPKTQQWLYETDVARPTAKPSPKVTPKPDEGTVDESASASQVRRVQRQLIVLGLLPEGADDGSYGATTVAAVRRFQKRVNELAGYDVLDGSGKTDAQILHQDFKQFSVGKTTFCVGQITSLNEEELMKLRNRMPAYLEKARGEEGVDLMFLMLTNILTESTTLVYAGQRCDDIVSEAFRVTAADHAAELPGVVSRKKQFVPGITAALQE